MALMAFGAPARRIHPSAQHFMYAVAENVNLGLGCIIHVYELQNNHFLGVFLQEFSHFQEHRD
jgi:hypothetical protein